MDIFELGAQLAIARRHRRLSQRALAAKADVSVEWLSKFERGDSMEPSMHRVMRCLNALGLDLRLSTYNHGRGAIDDIMRQNDEADVDPVLRAALGGP
jgi:transcriptional regulator with XRE-family HTH domain